MEDIDNKVKDIFYAQIEVIVLDITEYDTLIMLEDANLKIGIDDLCIN